MTTTGDPTAQQTEKIHTHDSRLKEVFWVINIHAEACRRWLSQDPPNLKEAIKSLEAIRRQVSPD